jgi:hypothetical protein
MKCVINLLLMEIKHTHISLFAADISHPYHQLLSPRLSELGPGGHNADSPPAGGIPSIALAPPAAAAAAFMASPSILGAFQPYSPFLPVMADSKTRKGLYMLHNSRHCDMGTKFLNMPHYFYKKYAI